MSTGLSVFDQTVQESNLWLKELEGLLYPCSRQQAYTAWRGVMHALRDQLPPQEVLHLSAQLPMLLRGVFLEGWRLADRPGRDRTVEDFIERASMALPPNFGWPIEHVTRAVFETLANHVSPGEVRDVVGSFTVAIRELWPPFVRAV